MSSIGQTVNERINSTHYNISYHQDYSRVSCEPGSDDVGPKQKNSDCTNGGCNSWAQAVLNNGPNQNTGSNLISGSQKDNSTIKGEHDALTRSALLSDNWGHTVINQDKAWDLPPSPQSSPKESISVWRSNPTNGTEIWENTVRHNKNKGTTPNNNNSANNSSVSQSWGHKPTTHIGGTWGEVEDASNVWTGVPPSNGSNNNHTNTNSSSSSSTNSNNNSSNNINNNNNNNSNINKSNWTESINANANDNAINNDDSNNNTNSGNNNSNVWNSGSDTKQWDSQNCHKPSSSSSWGEPGVSKASKEQDTGTSLWGAGQDGRLRKVRDEKTDSNFGTWSPPPKKDASPSGWEENASGGDKRNVDDGTAVWGNPTRQSKVSHWKETQNAKPITNYANNNNAPSQSGTNNSSGISSASPGMIRLPPGAPVISSKPSEVWNKVQAPQVTGRVWNDNSNRDPSLNQANCWGDNDQNKSIPGTPRSTASLGVWNDAPSRESSNQWDSSDISDQMKSIPGTPSTPGSNLGSGWGDPYWVNKPKTPTERTNWSESQGDISSWGATKQKALTKEMIWTSRQFRSLTEMGFKKEDVENVLRSRNLNFDEALAELRLFSANNNDIDLRMKQGTGMTSNTPSLLTTQGLNNNYPGLPSINSRSTSMFSQLLPQQPNYQQQQPQQQQQQPPQQQQQQQQVPPPSQQQQQQQQLQQQQQPNQQQLQSMANSNTQNFALVNQVQNALRSSNVRVGATQTLPSQKQVLQLVQQIKLAVQSGHLNAQMLNQPLAPTNIHLIYHLLQQIWTLQQLQAQIASPSAKCHDSINNQQQSNLHVQITLTKQRIANLQNHIAAQQATFLKQQQPQQQQQPAQSQSLSTNIGNNGGNNIHSLHGNTDILKNSELDSSLNINPDLRELSLKDYSGGNQSRLKTWKLPNFDKDDLGDFSRAVGSKQVNNINSVLSRSDSNSWSGVTSGDETINNWSDSIVSSSCNMSQVNDLIQSTNNISMQSQSAYDLNDLVPEFEPGKPWKGNLQLKSIEDDPHITPGSVNRLFSWPKMNSGTSGTEPSPTLSLSSSTWAFTPSINIPLNDKVSSVKTSGWGSITSDTTSTTDSLWNGSIGKARGPPPGLSQVKSQTNVVSGNALWNSDGRNSHWDCQQNGSAFLLLRNLTPQIDGSTLKTLCMQHGPLQLFHLFLNHGIALVRYSTKEEATKAQSALNNCVLGNTTILSEIPSDAEVQQYIKLGTAGQQMNNNHLNWALSGNNSNAVQNNNNNTSNAGFRNTSASSITYGNSGVTTTSNASNSNAWSGLWSYTPSSNNLWGAPSLNSHDSNATSSLQSLLPGDLLGGEST